MKFNARYNLRCQDSKKAEKIHLVCRFGGQRLVYPTAYNILPKHWNTPKGEIRNVVEEMNRDIINDFLKELKKEAKSIFDKAIAKRTQLPEIKNSLKAGLDLWTGKTVVDKPNFWRFINKYIAASPDRLDPKTGRKIGKRTIQEYNTTTKALTEFQTENRQTIDFDNINLRTLHDFRDYLTTVKGYAVNNVAKHIDNLRQFLRAANADKVQFDTDTINNKKFTNAREAAYNVYLNERELQRIHSLNLSDNARLDRVRDLFLVGCYTGLRVSDYNNIQPHNIKGDLIDLYQTKTGGRVVIPIHPTVKAILTKYGGKTPPKISEQKFNDYIKEVCKLAEITEQTEKQQTKGGAKVATVKAKWEMVSSHTARRSFATNAVNNGLNIQTIMAITGHQKENTFKKYVKLSAGEHAEIMRKHMLKAI